MNLSGIDYGSSLDVVEKVLFRSGGYGCSFVNGCGLVIRNKTYNRNSAC